MIGDYRNCYCFGLILFVTLLFADKVNGQQTEANETGILTGKRITTSKINHSFLSRCKFKYKFLMSKTVLISQKYSNYLNKRNSLKQID
jgi:hypothetical protein